MTVQDLRALLAAAGFLALGVGLGVAVLVNLPRRWWR